MIETTVITPNWRVDGDGNLTTPTFKKLLVGDTSVGKTIAAGVIDLTSTARGPVLLTSESGTADELTSITGLEDGEIVILRAAATHTITINHGGSIETFDGQSFSLTSSNWIAFLFDGTGLREYARSASSSIRIVGSQIPGSPRSVWCVADAGSSHSSVSMNTNSALIRQTGNVISSQVNQNEVLGRTTGGTLAGQTPNGFTFTEGSTNAKAGFRRVVSLTSIADAGSSSDTIPSATFEANGNFVLSIFVRATDESGNHYKGTWTVDLDRASSAWLDAAPATLTAIGTPDAEISLTVADSAGDLEVAVGNATGGGEDINVTIAYSWAYIPYPAAPA